MAKISLRQLAKQYPNGVRAVDGMDLEIADGEFFALLGPSGCGKTTLLRTIAGLEQATEGQILIGDNDVTVMSPGERNVAMVFQDYALLPHMNVIDNVAYPLRIQKVAKSERHARARETGAGLSLAPYMERRPSQLSGGQQQRVALARAIVVHPEVFLFDEPLSNLDARLRLEARTFLKKLQRSLGVTTVFVTHDQAEALAMADRMAVMEAGRIRQLGTPREVFQRPTNTFVANFIGSTPMNLLAATVTDGAVNLGASASLPLPPGVPDGANGRPITYGVRPEYVDFFTAVQADSVHGTVSAVENLGVSALVTVEVGEHSVGVVVPEELAPAVRTDAWLRPQDGRSLLYGEDGELLANTLSTTPAGA
jgi:multiple sugar transport system ATP-binding protein